MAAIQQNYRVVIEISDRRFTRDKRIFASDCKATCESIQEQVKRHIDDVGIVYIESDTQCEFCNCQWETDAKTGEPVCCDRAQQEFNSAKGVKA